MLFEWSSWKPRSISNQSSDVPFKKGWSLEERRVREAIFSIFTFTFVCENEKRPQTRRRRRVNMLRYTYPSVHPNILYRQHSAHKADRKLEKRHMYRTCTVRVYVSAGSFMDFSFLCVCAMEYYLRCQSHGIHRVSEWG